MKMTLICMRMKLHAELSFALRLVLKQRHENSEMAYSGENKVCYLFTRGPICVNFQWSAPSAMAPVGVTI